MKSRELSVRVRQLEAFVGAISMISTEIRYLASPVGVLMTKVDALEEYRELKIFGICADKLAEIPDFSKAWELSLTQARPFLSLNDGDCEALLWFGRVLGTTDVDGQTASCGRYADLLSQRLTVAREDRGKRGKLFSSLGVLGGIFFVVLFL